MRMTQTQTDNSLDSLEPVTGSAHGKLILVGEHSVVYGHPAVVVPFNRLTTVASVATIDGPNAIDCRLYRGPLNTLPDELRGLRKCIVETIDHLTRMDGWSGRKGCIVRVTSSIPPSRGLGSSAAVAAAVVRGLFAYHGQKLDRSTLFKLANIAEEYAHGTPSGIDLEAATADIPLWFRKGLPSELLNVSGAFHFVVADSGRVGDTRSAVAAVRASMASDRATLTRHMHRLGQLAVAAREALRANHHRGLGIILNAAQTELTQIGVSDAGLDTLVNAARNAGALGAKLTGGGRGGCILALARTSDHANTIASALLSAGAEACWAYTLHARHGSPRELAVHSSCF